MAPVVIIRMLPPFLALPFLILASRVFAAQGPGIPQNSSEKTMIGDEGTSASPHAPDECSALAKGTNELKEALNENPIKVELIDFGFAITLPPLSSIGRGRYIVFPHSGPGQ